MRLEQADLVLAVPPGGDCKVSPAPGGRARVPTLRVTELLLVEAEINAPFPWGRTRHRNQNSLAPIAFVVRVAIADTSCRLEMCH